MFFQLMKKFYIVDGVINRTFENFSFIKGIDHHMLEAMVAGFDFVVVCFVMEVPSLIVDLGSFETQMLTDVYSFMAVRALLVPSLAREVHCMFR